MYLLGITVLISLGTSKSGRRQRNESKGSSHLAEVTRDKLWARQGLISVPAIADGLYIVHKGICTPP